MTPPMSPNCGQQTEVSLDISETLALIYKERDDSWGGRKTPNISLSLPYEASVHVSSSEKQTWRGIASAHHLPHFVSRHRSISSERGAGEPNQYHSCTLFSEP